MATGKKFCLVCWIEEDSIGVMPSSSIKKGKVPVVGSIAEFKYRTKFYEAEVLRNSSK